MIKREGSSIRDVAKAAGVSAITVSRVINTPEVVREKTRFKVLAVMETLNYRPNLLAKSLRSSRTKTIGILLTTSFEEFQQSVFHGIESVLRPARYKILFGTSNNDIEIEKFYLDTFVSNKVDGIIIFSADNSDGVYLANIMNTYQIPIVQVDTYIENCRTNYVLVSNEVSIKKLAQHLLEAAGENIAYLSGPLTTYSGKILLSGFKNFLSENKIDYDKQLLRIGDYDLDSGEALTDCLIEEGVHFSSILASNYSLGLGALKSAFNHKINIPEDIKLAALDDFTLNPLLSVPITTLSRIDRKMGIRAAGILLEKIEQRDIHNFEKIYIGGELTQRRSSESG